MFVIHPAVLRGSAVSTEFGNRNLCVFYLIKRVQKDGWYEVNHEGSPKQFKHPIKKGRITVPHPKRDIPMGTLKSIEKQAGIKFKK